MHRLSFRARLLVAALVLPVLFILAAVGACMPPRRTAPLEAPHAPSAPSPHV
jgi:hypothetical protein